MQNLVKISRKLSKALRHNPTAFGLSMDKHGWVDVNQLLNVFNVERNDLYKIVQENDKKRFVLSEDKCQIRAAQGHSIDVDLQMQSIKPPAILFHGTTVEAIQKISVEGLLKMRRQHVHLSENVKTASAVGSRHGLPIVLRIDSDKMFSDDFTFYLSDNGVWLTDFVPPQYITIVSGQHRINAFDAISRAL